MLPNGAFDDIQLSARCGPSSSDYADTLSGDIENLQANHLIVVVFTCCQRIKVPFCQIENRANPWHGIIDSIDIGQFD